MEDKQERREERNERRQLQRDIREQELKLMMSLKPQDRPPVSFQPPFSSPESSFRTSTTPLAPQYTPPAPTPTPNPHILARQQFTTPGSRTSSPINAAEEDTDILALFFTWTLQNTRNNDRKVKWERARDIIMQNDWSIQDLQLMEDGLSAMYNRAIKAGISDGFTRGFREEIRSFKDLYRRQKSENEAEAIRALNLLGSAG